MIKKCRECGGEYETEDQKVTLLLNHKDIENLEDLIYTELDYKTYCKKVEKFQKVWKQLCDAEDNWDNPKKSFEEREEELSQSLNKEINTISKIL